ncbi:MAG: hypothetical protein ACHQX4_01045 [Gemmatimonadales bacterium]
MTKAKAERRSNPSLREMLDELVAHVRHVAKDVRTMSQQDLDYAQERLEWLAEEVWRAALEGRERSG